MTLDSWPLRETGEGHLGAEELEFCEQTLSGRSLGDLQEGMEYKDLSPERGRGRVQQRSTTRGAGVSDSPA